MSIFDKVGMRNVTKAKFNLSHHKTMSMNMGWLIPNLIMEVNPGEKFKVNTEILTRFAPLISPVMHRFDVKQEYFFVPIRLIWDDYENFFTGGKDGTLKPVMPQLEITNSNKSKFGIGKLPDYMEVPTIASEILPTSVFISSLPFRAYHQIYNDYYVDPNFGTEVPFAKTSGKETNANLDHLVTLRKRAWTKDYFTSALPSPQRGGEAILPIGDVTYKDASDYLELDGTAAVQANPTLVLDSGVSPSVGRLLGQGKTRVENIESVSPVAINDLRKATALQRWLENSMRGGPRYIEQVYAHFNQKSSDARLQRAEFLASSSMPMKISEVLNTAGQADPQTAANPFLPVGNMSGHGVSYNAQPGFKRKFEEHGFIIGICSVIPKPAYTQGIPRMYARADKYDFLWPEMANLGEQEVFNQELFIDWSDPADRKATFGYQSRYADYKYKPSTVHGDFRASLQHWQAARVFNGQPGLNESFIEVEQIDRIFAVTAENTHKIYMQVFHGISALRPMPYLNTPSIL